MRCELTIEALCLFLDNFWKIMSNQLLVHNVKLNAADHVRLEVCDRFIEGTYVPDTNKIILCSNIIYRREDFDNALKRQLIFMYDF